MPQTYDINDMPPRRKSPKPNSCAKPKNPSIVSPGKIRETKIVELRKLKDSKKFEFQPEMNSESSEQAPRATQVLVEVTPANKSLRDSQLCIPSELTDKQRRYLQYADFRRKISAVPGIKKKELEEILDKYFPDLRAEPEGMFDLFMPNLDSEAFTSAFQSVERLSTSVASLKNTSITHTIDLSQTTSGVVDKALEVANKAVDSMDDLGSILLVLAVVIVMRPTTYREKVLVGVIVIGFVASKSNLLDLWKNSSLCSWLSKSVETEVEPQSFSLDEMTTMIVGLLNTYVFLGSGTDLFSPTKLSKVINSISRTEIGVSSLTRTVHLLTSYIHSSIDHYWKGNPWFVSTGHSFIDEFLRESSEILLLHEERKLLDLRSSLDRVRACIVLGETVSVKIPGSHETVGLRLQVNNSLAEMKRIKKQLLASNFDNAGLRSEPTGLLLCGPPGVGKSNSMQHFAHAVNALTLSEADFAIYKENPASAIYTRNAENVYWEGYKQSHNVVFMDDIGQARDIQGSPDNEIMNTIRGINIFDYPLHMAEISSKGNTTFRSKFVMGNTNLQNFKFESIIQPGAFLRRWDVVVDVIPKDEFCVNSDLPDWQKRFDKSKLPIYTAELVQEGRPQDVELIGSTMIMPDMCWYHLKKMNADETGFVLSGERLTFEDVVRRVHATHERKERFHRISLQSLEETLEEYRESTSFKDIEMEDVEPQTRSRGDPIDLDYISRLNVGSRQILNDLRTADDEKFLKLDAVMRTVFVASETLGGIFWFQEAFDLALVFFNKFGYEKEIWEPYHVSSWQAFFHVFGEEIYVQTVQPREASLQVQNFVRLTEQSRSFLEHFRIINKTTPTWVSWVYRVYKYTLAHACMFKDNLLSGIANMSLANSPLLKGLLAVGSVVLAFKALTYIVPLIFPTKKKKRRSLEAALAESTDASIIEAQAEFAEAEAAYKVAQRVFADKTASIQLKLLEEVDPESDERANRSHRVKRSIQPKKMAKPQSIQKHNVNLVSIQQKIIARSVFKFYSPSGSEKDKHFHAGYAIAVHGRAILFPYHFLSCISSGLHDPSSYISEDSKIHLRRTIGDYLIISVTVGEIMEAFVDYPKGEEQDLVMIQLPSRCQPNPSCLKFFASEDKMETYKKFDALLSIPGPADFVTEMHPVVATASQYQRVGSDEYEPYTVKEVFKYTAYTSPGDCGSLLYVNDRSTTSVVVGMHVAGVSTLRCGFSAQISREFLDEYLAFLGVDDIVPPEIDITVPSLVATPNMNCVGEVRPDLPYPRAVGRTRIVHSHLHGLISPVVKAPARLRPFYNNGIRIDPNQLALAKYCKEDIHYDKCSLSSASHSLIRFLHTSSKVKVIPEIYSYEVAVLGDSSGFWTAVPRGTSSGYPWNCMPGPSSKTRFWGTEQDYDLENVQALALKARVESIICAAKKRRRLLHLYTDSLKDERRSMKKVEAGATRMISCCPVDLLIAFRMYFGAFQKWLVANRIENGCAIGINEHSSEWDLLARKLNRFGEGSNKGAGDHESFDTRHRSAMSEAILLVVETFYNGPLEDRTVRSVLWREITNSFHLNEGLIYEWFTALPSGAPPTTMFNCMANQIIFRMAWHDLTKRHNEPLEFDDHVFLCVLGDDNVFSVSRRFQSVFTETNLAIVMTKYGYVYTPEDKEVEFHGTELRPLNSVSFLKRVFYKHPLFGRYVGQLDILSISDMLQWQKESSSSYSDCETLIQTALEELSFYPQDVFEKWHAAILKACKSVEGIQCPLNSYGFFVDLMKGRDGEPRTEDFDGLLSDYGTILNAGLFQEDCERFEKEQGGLFKLTARVPCWRPQSNSGIQTNSGRLIHRPVLQRIATTTHSAGNTLTDQATPGLTRDGALETTRDMPIQSQQTSDTTKSTVDADTPITQITNYIPLNSSLLDSARTGVSQDVRAFLAKPVIIANGSFTTSDTYANFIYTNDGIPQSLLYAQPLWLNKLAGNYAFRGTLHLSIQVNATRFQQGRYILGWVPSGGGTQPNKFRRQHTASLTLATQCPHVEIDINCDTEATIIIPHITAQGWATLNAVNATQYGNNGSIFLAAYEPLGVSTGSPTATWTLFGHFEDTEFCMPAQPQSRSNVQTRVRRKVRVASEVEQESQGLGPLSAGLSMISAGSASISGVPFLSSVAGPLSWATALASKVAFAFGWSRPHNAAQTMMVQRFVSPRFTNADTADNSTQLSAMDSNSLEILPGFAGSDLDEMSLSYLTSISAFYKRLNWTTLNVQGFALLDNEQVTPRAYSTTSTIAATTITSLTPIAYFSSFFALYRGSVKFTFKLVKTEFHTGRLLVVFKPYEPNSGFPAAASFAGSAYEHREIIDVRLGNEFTLEFPYMSTSPYRACAGADSVYGIVYIYVLNALECPANVPQSVPILIEVSAGKDYELAEPCDMSGTPTQVYVPQSGRNVCEIVSEQIGNSNTEETNVPSRLCIGERVTSIRQLIKRFSLSAIAPAPGATHVWNPHQVDFGFIDASGFVSPTVSPDSLTYLEGCFALVRGGIRCKIITQEPTNYRILTLLVPYVVQTILPLASQLWTTTPSLYTGNFLGSQKPRAVFDTSTTGGSEFQVPFYHRFAAAAISDLIGTMSAAPESLHYQAAGPVPRNRVLNVFNATPASPPLVMRAGSEDYSLGLFVSVPPLTGYNIDYLG